ncbi:hypothetical protein PALB_32800 [Pseudoalteromonas luteoviolacea B = ATCC 29581]|nr:hypothetical protein PALB_32800 [Pseudoalteromonas luteoviolacea B = ATCC 29581]
MIINAEKTRLRFDGTSFTGIYAMFLIKGKPLAAINALPKGRKT